MYVSRNQRKSSMRADDFHDGQCTEKEKDHLADICQMFGKISDIIFLRFCDVNELETPTDNCHQERNGGLVDFRDVFDRDKKIPKNKCDEH